MCEYPINLNTIRSLEAPSARRMVCGRWSIISTIRFIHQQKQKSSGKIN